MERGGQDKRVVEKEKVGNWARNEEENRTENKEGHRAEGQDGERAT